ncbi:PucR family transcriptional regulator [Paenibacillus sp. URB8-2]|uniref:PucR family transcriptional regulator n=1 Tax=Paenibacillus sp. URB8-2 TaxID=2741301 RepID=UPI0015BD6A03|nr:helix-turn-helix domain-containing protein [Paenibacillus sp. URB8-2]BCG56822.1 transcriptional activator AdeR [Paenibacillus sp. URB8-2]
MTEASLSFDRFFDSMESLADAISESLQSQVTIEDDNHHVIGYSSHQFESDPARISTIIGKRVPDSVIIGLRKKGIMRQLENTPHPIRISGVMEVGLGPRLAMCIKHQKEVLGYIWVVDAGNLKDGYAESVVSKAAQIAARYLLKQRGWKTKQTQVQEDFFWKLLTSHYGTEQDIRRDAGADGITLPSGYFIGVFESDRTVDNHFLLKFRQTAEGYSGVSLVFLTTEHNRIIILFSFHFPIEGTQVLSSFMRLLIDQTNRNEDCRISGGCSLYYGEYLSAAVAYMEAASIAEIKRLLPFQARELLLYEDMGFWAHLPAIIEQKRSRNRRSPLLYPLKEHDRVHKTDFVKTVAVYLTFNGNLKESSSFLHIHTNTLMYRLNRIAEITGKNLKDTHYRFSIYLDILTEETRQLNQWFTEG